ncbi:MAG: leucine--tRNA ligase [Candidatus Handelsmanbacteria bacterium]|nr:leucine--tRNA ligase [Candidatus Handelsmanbacteria bacterium]
MSKNGYNYREIEARWRRHWVEHRTFRTPGPGEEGFDPAKPKCYVLDMFPYTSGSGLHIGHPKGYIATDIYSRFQRMRGKNVLHPMGFDSFGLPAEQYAVENNIHPAVFTEDNISVIREQLQFLGLGYDWDREVATSREDYYRWTQWIFLQLFNSWYDPDLEWQDEAGRPLRGRARPIAEMEAAFASGARDLCRADLQALGGGDGGSWEGLSAAQRAAVLNNYRLVYQREVVVNWCPMLGTVLANEEVTNEGKSERGDYPVYKRPLRQWIMRITAYGDRLLADLDDPRLPDGRGGVFGLEWPESVKLMQRNWIGCSEGAEIEFAVLDPETAKPAQRLLVFTTRPDTLFGATFMVIAPEHPLLAELIPSAWPAGVDPRWTGGFPDPRTAAVAYAAQAAAKAQAGRDLDKEKTGVFTALRAVNPVSGRMIPIFVADYVSMDYGTGAIMAVPAHDERDFEFARAYGIEVIQVVAPPPGNEDLCFIGDGVSLNSPAAGESPFAITGLPTAEAKRKICAALEQAGVGRAALSYKLRDWIFSRQRYWGEPFPLATHPEGYSTEVPIPVVLPEMEDFRPLTSSSPDSPVATPLSRAREEWHRVTVGGVECRRELNTMPQWAGSCWYYLRFIDPSNPSAFCDRQKERCFMPVDLYVGGAEHAVLHLLYSRFWHKVLFDLGHVSTPEPFRKLFNQGLITADAFADERGVYIDIREVEFREGVPYQAGTDKKLERFAGKMGKRYKNGLPPEEVGEDYGVDTLRLYEMYMGPLDLSTPWSMEGIRGMQRFLQRVWRAFVTLERRGNCGGEESLELSRLLHRTIKRVGDDLEGLRFNTAIAALIEMNNELVKLPHIPQTVARPFILLLAPFAPHLAEELWVVWGFGRGEISRCAWPEADPQYLQQATITLPIQINGKTRGNIEVPAEISADEIRARVFALENIQRHVPDQAVVKRFVVVPRKIVNIVV